MTGDHGKPRRARFLVIGAVCVLAIVILVVIGVKTRGFGLIGPSPRPAQDVARERCQADVRKQLASPETAQLSDVRSAAGGLQADGQDMFPLMTDEPLKGVDHSRITVWNVSGMIDAKAEAGGTIHDPFTCRAYFVDGNLADTLVLFDHAH